MDRFFQIVGIITLLIIAFFAGFMVYPSNPFNDSEEDLIVELNEIDNSLEIIEYPEKDNTPATNEIHESNNISDLKEPG